MGKNTFFPRLLITSLIAIVSVPGAFAATSASQTVTGTLGQVKQVVTNGGNITATISPTTGALSTALTPGFTLSTNSGLATPVALTATVTTSSGSENGFFGTGAAGSTFLMLTNSGALPTAGAVADAASGSPSAPSNANVIAYPVQPPADISGQLVYTWDVGNTRWNGSLTHKGDTNTLLTVPALTPRANTFSTADLDGPYQATITLSFV